MGRHEVCLSCGAEPAKFKMTWIPGKVEFRHALPEELDLFAFSLNCTAPSSGRAGRRFRSKKSWSAHGHENESTWGDGDVDGYLTEAVRS